MFTKKSMPKYKNKIIFPLIYLVMKMKHHTVFILHNKLLENMLIYNYCRVLKNFHYVLIKDFNRFMTDKTKHHGKKHFC